MDDGRVVVRRDFHRGMRPTGGRAADEQWDGKVLPLHFFGDVDHLFERRRDQPAQADQVHVLFAGSRQDFVAGHHHAEIDDLVVIAAEDDANDVLADVMHVAFDGGHENAALSVAFAGRFFLRFHERQQIGYRLLHYAGALHDLGQNHCPGAEQIPDQVHSCHERAFNHVEGFGKLLPRLFRVSVDVIHDAFDQGVAEALFNRALTPGVFKHLGLVFLFYRLGEFNQPLGGIGTAVEQNVLNQFQQVFRNFLIDGELAGIDDAYVHARLDGMVEKRRVHRFAHDVVAAEGKRNVAHAAADFAIRQGGFDEPGRFDEIDRVIVVLLHPGGHGEDVRIEDDVLGRKAGLLGEHFAGACADLDLALDGIRLALFVKSHHHHRGAVAANKPRLFEEFGLAFLEADGVDDRLALDALQARLQDRPLGAVDHDGDARNVRLGGNQVQESGHHLLRIEHAFIHVHVDYLRAAFDLLAGDAQRLFVIAGQDEFGEFRRAGHVGAFADVHEIGFRSDRQGFQAAQARVWLDLGRNARRAVPHRRGNRPDVRRSRAAATADDIQPAVGGELPQIGRHDVRRFIETAESIGEARVGIATDVNWREARKL